jgi:DNA-binding CsgD family transcriptional regulator
VRVFALLSEGLSNKQIAWQLGISTSTTKCYVSEILKATGCRNRTQAALLALRCRYGLPPLKSGSLSEPWPLGPLTGELQTAI